MIEYFWGYNLTELRMALYELRRLFIRLSFLHRVFNRTPVRFLITKLHNRENCSCLLSVPCFRCLRLFFGNVIKGYGSMPGYGVRTEVRVICKIFLYEKIDKHRTKMALYNSQLYAILAQEDTKAWHYKLKIE